MEGVEKERGRIKIDGRLRVPGMDGVFAMGDAAANPENPLGPLAQVADQQGKVTGDLVYFLLASGLSAGQGDGPLGVVRVLLVYFAFELGKHMQYAKRTRTCSRRASAVVLAEKICWLGTKSY